MPFLGKEPAFDLASTSDLGDNVVTEAKLKDALVGDFTEVTVTASDSILLADATDSGNTKRDTVQGILDLAGGGGLEFVSRTNISSAVASVDLTDLEEGSEYFIHYNVYPTTEGSSKLHLLYSVNNGSAFITANYSYNRNNQQFNTNSYVTGGTSQSEIDLNPGASEYSGGLVSEGNVGTLRLHSQRSGAYRFCDWNAGHVTVTPQHMIVFGFGVYTGATTAIDAIRLIYNTGTIAGGHVDLHKKVNS